MFSASSVTSGQASTFNNAGAAATNKVRASACLCDPRAIGPCGIRARCGAVSISLHAAHADSFRAIDTNSLALVRVVRSPLVHTGLAGEELEDGSSGDFRA